MVQIHNSKGTKQSSRAWSQIHSLDVKIKTIVSNYNHAREACARLRYADEDYRPITKSDLQMSADITEVNRIGQRSYKLPWFW